jgi:hypothetical protein
MLAVAERGSLMSFLPSLMQRLAMVIIIALALLVALGACAARTPTPTPVPVPVIDPFISLNDSSTFRDLVALLPSEALNCLIGKLGRATYAQFLDLEIFGEGIGFDGDLPVACFDQNTITSLVIVGLSQAASGLTGPTVACVREAFKGLDVASLAAITSGGISGSVMNGNLGFGLGVLLCLNDDEASRTSASAIFGDIGGLSSTSLSDVKCILQVVDLTQLSGLFESLSVNAELDISTSPALLTAVTGCGIDIRQLLGSDLAVPLSDIGTTGGNLLDNGSVGGARPPLFDLSDLSTLPPGTQVMVQCMVGALGADNINGLLAGTYVPPLEGFTALGACNFDIAQLGSLKPLLSR